VVQQFNIGKVFCRSGSESSIEQISTSTVLDFGAVVHAYNAFTLLEKHRMDLPLAVPHSAVFALPVTQVS